MRANNVSDSLLIGILAISRQQCPAGEKGLVLLRGLSAFKRADLGLATLLQDYQDR